MFASAFRISRRTQLLAVARQMSADAKPAAPAPAKRGGAGLFQRLSSFLIGAGVTALGTQYLVFHELHEGNKTMLSRQQALEARVAALEKKK
mmetsp:Transcript_9266/g.15381  ORF Transcript_9266/g.15381 Transcript_9266/m.15381 type:complete len:92 (-) Transcript_9266:527-802(-)|eukprot:CAMPEP_0197726582 /NCGR_PEP_ID=MMETSP1434-20131217/16282_1 /TAXON_ID=265543 /ORGANISM="Minutocellus polymorphus, Strain CCMP3303" /LENGTH=91 /DNA_ID=CAMNT_0043312561 /DNA_START=59 /DNA_END=334 /DNA_ORIENTATION=+